MSSLALEGPRVTIAKNILVFRKIGKSVDEASLEMAAKHSPTVDPSNLHNAIKDLEGYLSSATPAAGAAGFQKDPTAWQNMEFGAFVGAEAARDDTWPFLVGGMYVKQKYNPYFSHLFSKLHNRSYFYHPSSFSVYSCILRNTA
jgi:hypothetical protein